VASAVDIDGLLLEALKALVTQLLKQGG